MSLHERLKQFDQKQVVRFECTFEVYAVCNMLTNTMRVNMAMAAELVPELTRLQQSTQALASRFALVPARLEQLKKGAIVELSIREILAMLEIVYFFRTRGFGALVSSFYDFVDAGILPRDAELNVQHLERMLRSTEMSISMLGEDVHRCLSQSKEKPDIPIEMAEGSALKNGELGN